MTEVTGANSTDSAEPPKNQFSVQRVYSKNSSFALADFGTLSIGKWQPQIKLEINTKNTKLADNQYEGILSLKVNVECEDKELFTITLEQAGAFVLKGFEEADAEKILGIHCPTILFPYASQRIATMITQAGFPASYLPTINFQALYEQRKKKENEENTANIITDPASDVIN